MPNPAVETIKHSPFVTVDYGTIHFTYNNKLIHIAGGMTDAEGRQFLQKTSYLPV